VKLEGCRNTHHVTLDGLSKHQVRRATRAVLPADLRLSAQVAVRVALLGYGQNESAQPGLPLGHGPRPVLHVRGALFSVLFRVGVGLCVRKQPEHRLDVRVRLVWDRRPRRVPIGASKGLRGEQPMSALPPCDVYWWPRGLALKAAWPSRAIGIRIR
jgi:hypothetical protein